jgi:hypothetical protein
MRVQFRSFRSEFRSWDGLFEDAATYASRLGPERLISISHSHGGSDLGGTGVVTVWYWQDDESSDREKE